MTTPTPAPEATMSPEEVARKLTKASTRALPLIGEDWTNEGWDRPLPNPNDVYSLWWGRNRGFGLVENRLREGTGVPCRQAQWQWRLTPLGLAVQAILKGQS